jgi:hypothetical protein
MARFILALPGEALELTLDAQRLEVIEDRYSTGIMEMAAMLSEGRMPFTVMVGIVASCAGVASGQGKLQERLLGYGVAHVAEVLVGLFCEALNGCAPSVSGCGEGLSRHAVDALHVRFPD